MAITKQQLDNYFTEKYTEIKLYIEKSFSKHNVRGEDSDFFFSEAYIYLEQRMEDMDTEQDIKNYLSTFIHNNTYWVNSSVREAENYTRRVRHVEYVPSDFENETDDEEQMEEDSLMNEYSAVIEMYYHSLMSVEKKAVWEIYFIEKKRTISAFAEHIQMSRTVADKFIKELKSDIREYYKDYKSKQNTI